MRLTQDPVEIITALRTSSLGNRYKKPLNLVLKFPIGLGLGYILLPFIPEMTYTPGKYNALGFIPLAIGLFVISYYFNVIIHELGHLVGAQFAGFRFVMTVWGPLQIRRQNNNLKVGYAGRRFLGGGFIVCVPHKLHNLSHQTIYYLAGGPLASLLLTATVYTLLRILQNTPISIYLGLGLVGCFLSGLLSLMLSLWPRKINGLRTDGGHILVLWRGGPPAERVAATYLLGGISMAGQRPRNYDPGLVAKMVTLSDSSAEEALGNFTGYAAALDRGQFDQAASHLNRALSLWVAVSPLHRPILFLEAAYFEARHGADPIIARYWLELVEQSPLVEKHTPLRAEAAILLAEGQYELAIEAAQRGLAFLPRAMNPTEVTVGTDRFNDIIAVARERMQLVAATDSLPSAAVPGG
ncbi:MAG: hypothetical protein FOGNACKC_01988 [Anaerolineae bacterium]|nr:hypothetical protein [Anaerolineae bacterium]